MTARLSPQESIKRYWSRRVGIPSAIMAIGLVLFVIGFLLYSTRQAEKRTLDAAGSTLAMVVSDPILLGDELEVEKRISLVAKRHDLSVIVQDATGKTLSIYPPTADPETSVHDSLGYEITANDGRMLGHVLVKKIVRPSIFDGFLVLVLSLVGLFSAIIIWVIKSARPIADDILALASIESQICNKEHDERAFRFSETQQTFATLQETFQKLDAQAKELLEIEKSKFEIYLAKQVAHDIRSPLEAIRYAMPSLNLLPEEVRIPVRSAFFRIEDIANTLLQKNALPLVDRENVSIQLLSSLIEPLISEKRLQYRSNMRLSIEANLSPSSYGLFAKVNPGDFKRMLSNLIDNGVQALSNESGTVKVDISGIGEEIFLEIRDSGAGIPEPLIEKLGQQGLTTKPDGNGLGLYHAKSLVAKWGGKLEIQSIVGKGTLITIRMPRCPSPNWFVPELAFGRDTTVCVLDDDQTIHHLWEQRFENLIRCHQGLTMLHFSTGKDLANWHRDHGRKLKSVLFLCDHELIGQEKNGLAIIEQLGIQAQSVLVTSRYEEADVREICQRLGVKLVPKGLARLVPISVSKNMDAAVDCYLIDNDFLIEMTWASSARMHGKRIGYFKSPEEFIAAASSLNRHTPVYIDNDFGPASERGESASKKIRELGFERIYLATASGSDSFGYTPWLDGIVSKTPPWEETEAEELALKSC